MENVQFPISQELPARPNKGLADFTVLP